MILMHACIMHIQSVDQVYFFCVFSASAQVYSVMSTNFLQSGQDCFLFACLEGHQTIVHELLTRYKVDQNVVDNVRN